MLVDISRRNHHSSNDDYHKLAEQLDGMSTSELTILLEQALESMSEETYDAELIDTYLDALDRKAPIPEILDSDIDSAYANFERLLRSLSPESTISAPSGALHKTRHALRIRLVAIVVAICLLGSLCVAQAAGVNVFEAFARWTSEIFSLGEIHSNGTTDNDIEPFIPEEYRTLQDALDAFGVTEISAPTWFPEGYQLDGIDVTFSKEDNFLYLSAEYSGGTNSLQIIVKSYVDEPDIQIEKMDASVDTLSANGVEIYFFANTNNCVAAWASEHYECCISGTVNASTLKQIALSACANNQ